MDRLVALREERDALADSVEAITMLAEQEDRDLTEDEQKEIDAVLGDDGSLAEINAKIDRLEKIEDNRRKLAAARGAERIITSVGEINGEVNMAAVTVPARAKSRGKIKGFEGANAEKEAYLAGLFYLAAFQNNVAAAEKLSGFGIQMAQTTADNSKGGYLVPELLEASIIRLVEEYGSFRQHSKVMPMGVGGSISVPRRTGGYTAYFVNENEAGTESDLTLDQIQLVAKKLMILSRWSSELPEDAIVQIGDLVSQEIAYAIANKEDECGWNGDGTSTYGGIRGVADVLAAGSVIDAPSGDNTMAEIEIGVFQEAMGNLPRFPGLSPAWYCHQSFFANVMQRLAFAAGGNATSNYEGGMGRSFMGYPVHLVNVMASGGPSTDLAGSFGCYFGDLSMAATFGDKRGLQVASDGSVYFTSDAIALRATRRFDINVHERGTASEAGPLLGIKFTA